MVIDRKEITEVNEENYSSSIRCSSNTGHLIKSISKNESSIIFSSPSYFHHSHFTLIVVSGRYRDTITISAKLV